MCNCDPCEKCKLKSCKCNPHRFAGEYTGYAKKGQMRVCEYCNKLPCVCEMCDDCSEYLEGGVCPNWCSVCNEHEYHGYCICYKPCEKCDEMCAPELGVGCKCGKKNWVPKEKKVEGPASPFVGGEPKNDKKFGFSAKEYNKKNPELPLKCNECLDSPAIFHFKIYGKGYWIEFSKKTSKLIKCSCGRIATQDLSGIQTQTLFEDIRAGFPEDENCQAFFEAIYLKLEFIPKNMMRSATKESVMNSLTATPSMKEKFPLVYKKLGKFNWYGAATGAQTSANTDYFNIFTKLADSWADFFKKFFKLDRDVWLGTFVGIMYAIIASFGSWIVVAVLWYWQFAAWIQAIWALCCMVGSWSTISAKLRQTSNLDTINTEKLCRIMMFVVGALFGYRLLRILINVLTDRQEKGKMHNQSFKAYKGVMLLFKGLVGLGLQSLNILGTVKVTHKQYKEIMDLFNNSTDVITGVMLMQQDDYDFMMHNQAGEDDEDFAIPGVTVDDDEEDLTFGDKFEVFKEHLKEFWDKYKWIVIGATSFCVMMIFVVTYFKKKELHNEGKGKKFTRVEKGFYVDNNNDPQIAVKGSKKTDRAGTFDQGRQKWLEYQDMKDRQAEYQRQLLWSMEPIVGRMLHKDRPVVTLGEISPEKLLGYDTIVIRVGKWETPSLNLKKREDAVELLHKLQEKSLIMKKPILIGLGPENNLKFMRLGVQNEAALDRQHFKDRAKLCGVDLTDEELTTILSNPKPLAKFSAIIIDKVTKGHKEGLHNEASSSDMKNEALVGGLILDTTKLESSVIPLHNTEYGSNFYGVCVEGKIVTVAHGVYDIPLKTDVKGTVTTRGQESEMEELKLIDETRDADWAIFENTKIARRSAKVCTTPYNGFGFIYLPGGRLSVGVVVVQGTMCWHYIPTQDGHSGAPIFNAKGEVIAIHKASSGLANVGVPIRIVLERNKTPIKYMNAFNQGVKENFNLSYLPPSMQPRFVDRPVEFTDDLLGPEFSYEGAVAYRWKEYGKHKFNDLYLEKFEEFGLPNPIESGWGVAIPTIGSITKDFSKYTVSLRQKVKLDKYYKALALCSQWFKIVLNGHKLHLLSNEQLFETVNGQASNGWPVNQVCMIKADFIKKYFGSVEEFLRQIKEGFDPDVFFDELGKEELRDVLRLLLNKIRSFNSGGVHLYALERKVFGQLCEAFNDRPFFITHSTLGWSPFYGNWNELVRYMKALKTGVYSNIDFTKWDSRFQPLMFEGILSLVMENYAAEDYEEANIYCNWWYKHVVIEALCVLPITEHVAVIVMVFRGMKSGCLVTFLFNCVGNVVRHVYCVIHIFDVDTWSELLQITVFVSCGDDFTFALLCEFEMKYYCECSADWCWEVEEYICEPPLTGKMKFIFAGCETNWLGLLATPFVDLGRFAFNIAIVKKGMSLAQYLQKLDNLIRIAVISDMTSVIKLMALRDWCVDKFGLVPGVAEVAQGFCDLITAIQMHDYIYEADSLITCEPHKNNVFINQATSSIVETEFKYHGNYCGPGWSNGSYQSSVEGSKEPIDKLDSYCKEHDSAYARGENLEEADFKLAEDSWKEDKLLSTTIYLQALYRKYIQKEQMARKNGKKKEARVLRAEIKQIGNEIKKEKAQGARIRRSHRTFRRGRQGASSSVSAMYGGAIRGRIQRSSRSEGGKSLVVSGQDFLEPLSSGGSGKTAGDVLVSFGLSAASWPTSRLVKYFEMFEKWEIKRVEIDYDPAIGTLASGSVAIGIDPDPSDAFPETGTEAITKIMSNKYSKMIQISRRGKVVFKPEKKQTDMFTSFSDSERFSSYGNVFVVAGTNLAANLALGNLIVRYVIKFYQPLLESSSSSHGFSASLTHNASNDGLPVTSIDDANPGPQSLCQLNGISLVTLTAVNDTINSTRSRLTFLSGGVYLIHISGRVQHDPGDLGVNANLWDTGSYTDKSADLVYNVLSVENTPSSTFDYKMELTEFLVTSPGDYIEWAVTGTDSWDTDHTRFHSFQMTAIKTGGIGMAKKKSKVACVQESTNKALEISTMRKEGEKIKRELEDIRVLLALMKVDPNNNSGRGTTTPKTK